VSSHAKELQLDAWEEIVGKCNSVSIEGTKIILFLTARGQELRIAFNSESKEAIALRKIRNKIVGKKIGLLKTDDAIRPIAVRIIENDHEEGSHDE